MREPYFTSDELGKKPSLSKGLYGPSQVLVGGFLGIIAIVTFLLMLPVSTAKGQGTDFIDALFTATSAVCVTGLSVVNTTAHWSTFGKIVILLSIQIGGLGFMTLVSMTFILTGRKISLKNRLVMREALNFNTMAGVVRFTKSVVKLTLVVEGLGAFLLCFSFVPKYGFIRGIGLAIFHSVSAFCNAGFDLLGYNSLMSYVGDGLVNFTIIFLIVMGGLGFSVWLDTYNVWKIKRKAAEHFTWRQALYKLTLHTKLVWIISLFLIVVGAAFIFTLEYANPQTLGELTGKEKIYASLFQSVTLRTAGFNTISLDKARVATKLFMLILMFIGASPGGMAGGIKTVTVGVLILSALSTIRGEDSTVIFKRKIPQSIIMRALTIIIISITILFTGLLILTVTDGDAAIMDILFEGVSAFSTTGLSLGITPLLSLAGKLTIIVLMFIGRLGPVTIAVALMLRQSKNKGMIQYPEEKILVG
jgi:trk system potassium uptake protein TrkH